MPKHVQWLVEGCQEKTIAAVKTMAAAKMEMGDIAKEIGATEKSLSDWMHRRGHSKLSLYPEARQPKWLINGSEGDTIAYLRVFSMNSDGGALTYRQLAKKLGINVHTLQSWLRGQGLSKQSLAEWEE